MKEESLTRFFAPRRLRPTPKAVLAVLCLSLPAVVYTAELVLAGLNSGPGIASKPSWSIDRGSAESKKRIAAYWRGAGVEFDTRDRSELLADWHKRGIDAAKAVMLGSLLGSGDTATSSESINADTLMPLGGISNTLSVLCNESGQYVAYESDEHGFRNPHGSWESARADMAAVGESFVQGYCVPDGKGFVDLLRTHYPVTLNLGMSGQSSLLQLAAIREYLSRSSPKIVLWVFCEGIDLDDLHDESMHPLLMRYLEPTFSQHLLTRQLEIDRAWRRFLADGEIRWRETQPTASGSSFVSTSLGILKLWNLREKLNLIYGFNSFGINSHDAEVWSEMEQKRHSLLAETLTQAQAVTRNWGGTLYFLYLPSWNRYRNGPRVPERERTRVLNLVNALGIPVIDVQPAFQAHNDPLSLFPFRRFGHYNETGNQIVAETVLTFLSAHERGSPLDAAGKQAR